MQSDRHLFNFNRKISKILSGDKESNKKTYIKYKYSIYLLNIPIVF